jgi:uncharacterized protein
VTSLPTPCIWYYGRSPSIVYLQLIHPPDFSFIRYLLDFLKLGGAFCYNQRVIVDFHTHIFPPRIKADRTPYIHKDRCFSTLYSDHKAKLATADDLIAGMDRDGVDISVVMNIGWTRHELCVETNDYILEAINRYPKRLVGFCAFEPASHDAALKEIERCAKAGIKGVGELRPDIQDFDIGDESTVGPLVAELAKHKLIMATHSSEPVGHEYQGKGGATPGLLYRLISRHPSLRLVCAHWGGGLPFYALMPEVRRALQNVYFDTAASPFLYSSRVYQQVVELVGADKVLFGTDYPLMSQRRALDEVNTLDIPAETKEMILGGNAVRLLGL